jgi:hypothetical protein
VKLQALTSLLTFGGIHCFHIQVQRASRVAFSCGKYGKLTEILVGLKYMGCVGWGAAVSSLVSALVFSFSYEV